MTSLTRFFRSSATGVLEKHAEEAYDLWSEFYDNQPDNLMLHLDGQLVGYFLDRLVIRGKHVADIGCGTGRHWPELFTRLPSSITGFDVSAGMLGRLKDRFPAASTYKISDDRLPDATTGKYDLVISTLTIAHLPDLETALTAWCRIAAPNAEILITDFHPQLLAEGGQRTFRHLHRTIGVRNYVHSLPAIVTIMERQGFSLVEGIERRIDESMKSWYLKQKAAAVYERYLGSPVIYGMHFKRTA